MKSILEKIEKLYEEFDSKKESMILIYRDEDGLVSTYSCGHFNELVASIATLVDDSLTNENIGESGKFIANVIKEGVKAVLSIPTEAGRKLAREMTSSVMQAILLDKIGINSIKETTEFLCNEDDEDEDDENCETCKANRVCPLPQAIKYRKENGIPSPHKKSKKSKKKHDTTCN